MKKQAGQAFILVLIVLAIGALLVVPSLRLTGTALMNSPIVERQTKGLYAADAALEYILWKLAYDNLGQEFTVDGQSAHFEFYVCDVPVGVTIVMRATEGKGGITLAMDDLIRPTKKVEVEGHPEWSDPDDPQQVNVSNGYPGPYTYIIRLEQLSSDNSKGLDSVYDVLPKKLSYVNNSAQLRVDGGAWETFPNPLVENIGGQSRLRWPASGFFTSAMRDFDIRQVKEIKFQTTGSLANDTINYNWVLLNVEDVDTLSGSVAPIKLGAGTKPRGGLITVTKACDHDLIPPGVETELNYTISITNLEEPTEQIYSITDYLPPEFEYVEFLDSEIVFIDEEGIEHWVEEIQILELDPLPLDPDDPERYNPENDISLIDKNGVVRPQLRWRTQKFPLGNAISLASGQTLKLTFRAKATKDVSGTYYNEVIVVNKYPLPGSIFTPPDMDVGEEDFLQNYSWNTGAVVVPAYDTTSESEGITINANMALILGGITITSWQVY